MTEIESAVDVVEDAQNTSITFDAWFEGSTGIERSVKVLSAGFLISCSCGF